MGFVRKSEEEKCVREREREERSPRWPSLNGAEFELMDDGRQHNTARPALVRERTTETLREFTSVLFVVFEAARTRGGGTTTSSCTAESDLS